MKVPRAVLVGGGALFAAALALRLPHIGWGLPLRHAHIDESVVVFYAMRVMAGEPNPQVFFDYPSLFLYLLAAAFQLAYWGARLAGSVENLNAAFEAHAAGTSGLFFLAARGLNVLLGSLSVLLAAELGARTLPEGAPGRRFVGGAAGLLLAVNGLHVAQAHYGTVDVAAAFFTLAALALIVRYWESGAVRSGAWAALAVGLAAAVKYYPGLLALPLAAAAFRAGTRPWRTAAALAALCAAGFALGTPFSFLSPNASAGRFLHLFPKIVWTPGTEGAVPFTDTFRHLLTNAGPAALAASAAGIVVAWRDGAPAARLLAGVLGGLLLFFGAWRIQLEHYALAAYPLIFVFAAWGARGLTPLHRFAPALAVGLLAAVSLPRAAAALERIGRTDTRLEALDWVRRELPPGSRLLRFANTPEFGPSDPYQVRVDWENKRLAAVEAGQEPEPFDYLLYGTYAAGDETPERLAARYERLKTFEGPVRFPHHPAVHIYGARAGKGDVHGG